MDNETAGQFFKHYLRYINDLHPVADNILVDLTFESVKQNLKRDLKKWEQKSNRNRESANMRWQQKNANACERIKLDAKNADRDKVTDTDKVIDKVIDKDIDKDNVIDNSSYKNIIQKSILDILTDYDVDIKKYNEAIEDYNEIGGIDEIAKIMEWDDNQKEKWKQKILNIYSIK
jgi:hypothetical protein